MTPLSEALEAAQKRALAAMTKAYVVSWPDWMPIWMRVSWVAIAVAWLVVAALWVVVWS